MTIVEWFAVMGLVAFVGIGAIAVILIGDYVFRCSKRHIFTDADMHCSDWSEEE